MRSLYLEDYVGNKFYFDYRENVLLSGLSGLGVERKNSYLKYTDSFKLSNSDPNLNSVGMVITFLKGYAGYSNFLNFIKGNNGDLKLYYYSDNIKFAYVELKSLDKTELFANTLQCRLTFEKLSHWLVEKSYLIEVNENSNNKLFPFTYPFIYSNSFDGSISVTNNGFKSAPVRIEILGICENPEIEIIKDEVVISKARILIKTTDPDDVIVIDAEDRNQELSLISNNEKLNIYSFQDFSCDNFLYLDTGDYTIKFNVGVSEPTRCKFNFIELYEGN